MKILFLNPHLHDSPLLGTLRGLGVAAIVCSDLRECELVFKLHATSVSLFVGHDEAGVGMNEILKTTPRFARVPVILTTSKWTDQQCIEHQAGTMGANAYLRMPVDDKEFIHVVDQILGTELSHGKGFKLSDDLSAIAPIEAAAPIAAAPALEVGAPLEIASAPAGDIGLALASVDEKTSVSLSLGSLDGGAPLEIAPATEATSLSIGSPIEAATPVAAAMPETDGVTLQTDVGSLAISPSGGLQIEDAAAVYGQETPGAAASALDPDLMFNLDAPPLDHPGEPPASGAASDPSGHTKEFRIEGTLTGEPPGASEIIATPIEATSIDTLAPLGDDQATRVATPILDTPAPIAEERSRDDLPREDLPSRRTGSTSARTESTNDEIDADSLAAMPYLSRDGRGYPNPLAYREPMDDAVVPGGAATAPDTETLKKYLYLREQDVSALSAQLRQAREQIGLLEGQLRHERAVSSEFAHLAQEQDRRIDGFEKEKAVALEAAQKEYDDLKFEMKRRSEKIRVMELQVREATEATERLKERVRSDIRKIRTREKELENRLEIMKKDSEALLASREQKIIELKRKLDLMEFNTDLVQDLLEKERQTATALREKLAKAAQMMRVAGGLLGPEEEAMLGVGAENPGVNDDERTTAA